MDGRGRPRALPSSRPHTQPWALLPSIPVVRCHSDGQARLTPHPPTAGMPYSSGVCVGGGGSREGRGAQCQGGELDGKRRTAGPRDGGGRQRYRTPAKLPAHPVCAVASVWACPAPPPPPPALPTPGPEPADPDSCQEIGGGGGRPHMVIAHPPLPPRPATHRPQPGTPGGSHSHTRETRPPRSSCSSSAAYQ